MFSDNGTRAIAASLTAQRCGILQEFSSRAESDGYFIITTLELEPAALTFLYSVIAKKRSAVEKLAKLDPAVLQMVNRDQWVKMFGNMAGNEVADYFTDRHDESVKAVLMYAIYGQCSDHHCLFWRPNVGLFDVPSQRLDTIDWRKYMRVIPGNEYRRNLHGVRVLPYASTISLSTLHAP